MLWQWLQKERPSSAIRHRVDNWLDGLRKAPRQAPSHKWSQPHPHASDEFRHARIPGTAVDVVYAVRRESESGSWRLLKIESHLDLFTDQ